MTRLCSSCCGSNTPPRTPPPVRPAQLPIRTEPAHRLPLDSAAYRAPIIESPERTYSNGNAIAGPSSSQRYSDPPRRMNGEPEQPFPPSWNRNQGFNHDDSNSSPCRVPSLPRGARATRRDKEYRSDSFSSAGQRSAGPYSSSTHENGNGNGFATQQQRGGTYREATQNGVGGNGYYANAAVRAVAQNMAEGEGKLSVGIDFGFVVLAPSLHPRWDADIAETGRPSRVSPTDRLDSSAARFDRYFLGQDPTKRRSSAHHAFHFTDPDRLLLVQISESPDLYSVRSIVARRRSSSNRLGTGSEERQSRSRNRQVRHFSSRHLLRLTMKRRCEWFKLFLSPESLRARQRDPRLPALPHGKEPVDVIVDFLSCLWTYAKGKITEEIGSVVDLGQSLTPLTSHRSTASVARAENRWN